MTELAVRAVRGVGRTLERLGRRLAAAGPADPFAFFYSPEARAINAARHAHLASLQLPLAGRCVLEVGAGIGLHTAVLEALGCEVTSTDGRPENVAEMRRRGRHHRTAVFDLEDPAAYAQWEPFDVIYCYGVLYHLADPERVLRALARLSRELILLETCVTPGRHEDVHHVRERPAPSQAMTGIGCRPTRPWVMARLREAWGHAYVPWTQPDHEDYPVDWLCPPKSATYRAVFIGSKQPLTLPTLTADLPDRQRPAGPA